MYTRAIITIKKDKEQISILRDYEEQPFGDKGVLATLAEESSFHKKIDATKVFELAKALCEAWQIHSKGVRILDEKEIKRESGDIKIKNKGEGEDKELGVSWVYDVLLSSSGDHSVKVSIIRELRPGFLLVQPAYQLEHLLTISLAQAKAFTLLVNYDDATY